MGRLSLAPALLLASCTAQDVPSTASLPVRQAAPLHDQCQTWDRTEQRPLLDPRADFGKIVTELISDEPIDPKLQKKLKKSEAEFREEAARQLKLVRDAGGYCALPVVEESSRDDLDFPDQRLGYALADMHQKAYDLIPDEDSTKLKWSVILGRADCSYGADKLRPDQEGVSPALLETYGKWLKLSQEVQGGLDTHTLKDNPKLAAQLLVERGTDLLAGVGDEEARVLREKWQKECAPSEQVGDPFTALQEEQFRGSYLLSKAVLQDSPAAQWTVSHLAGEGINADLGYNRDTYCGQVYKCESDGATKEYLSVQ